MARGGYFQGGDWVEYSSGPLSESTATSQKEMRKQDTVKCPRCNRIVPLKRVCIFCDNILLKEE